MTPEELQQLIDILNNEDIDQAANSVNGINLFGNHPIVYSAIFGKPIKKPEDAPFYSVDELKKWWANLDIEAEKRILAKITEYGVKDLYQGRICDFFWFVDKKIDCARRAMWYYRTTLKCSSFSVCFWSINRYISLAKAIGEENLRKKEIVELLRETISKKVNANYDYCFLLKIAKRWDDEKGPLIRAAEDALRELSDSQDYILIGKYCDLLLSLYDDIKNSQIQKEKIIWKKARAIIHTANNLKNTDGNDKFRRANLLKNAVNELKALKTEDAKNYRKQLLFEIQQLEEEGVKALPLFQHSGDASQLVAVLMKILESLEGPEEYMYFLANCMNFLKKKEHENVILSNRSIIDLFSSTVIGSDGRVKAKVGSLTKNTENATEIDKKALQLKAERSACREIVVTSQIVLANVHRFIQQISIPEAMVREIVIRSGFVPPDRIQLYTKGLYAGIKGDFLTALCILTPQIENSIRHIAEMCGEPVYNLKEDGTEELKTFHALLEAEKVQECLDEDFLFTLKTVFVSPYGLNFRNEFCHGILSDAQYQTYTALYIWWLIFKCCYMLSPLPSDIVAASVQTKIAKEASTLNTGSSRDKDNE